MATQPKLPFSLALVLHPEGERRVLNLEKFTTDEASAEVSAYFLEYTDCDLEFRAIEEPPEEAWVTIDGFDALFNTQREGLVDRYGRLVLCCNHTLPIQRHNESEFPWIPGNYRVEVRWGTFPISQSLTCALNTSKPSASRLCAKNWKSTL